MKANEFIKEKGIEEARKFLEAPSYSIDQLMFLKSGVDVGEIERLIESHDLVISYGGLAMAKRQYDCFDNARKRVGISPSGKVSALGKAIADVESCQ